MHGGFRSAGHKRHIEVQAWCQCGWSGPRRQLRPGARAAEGADLTAHLVATGHQEFPVGVPSPDGYHPACGHFHTLDDACPVPAVKPPARLPRTAVAAGTEHSRALERLTAIEELREWLDDQEQQAAIGARMARCSWTEMGQAIGASKQAAWNRWGKMVARYETTALAEPESS